MSIKRILVINANSSPKLTEVLDNLIKDHISRFPSVATIESYTAPSGPPSIDSDHDALVSARAIMADLQFRLEDYDAYLVASYCVHPLVSMLKARVSHRIHVIGIFEASILTALSLLPTDSDSKFGIIASDAYWVDSLTKGINKLCCTDISGHKKFKGVGVIGLTADEIYSMESEEISSRVKKAAMKLIEDHDVRVICLGCSSMARFSGAIDDALREEFGDQARPVYILESFQAGICLVENLLRAFPA
ncbi:hypothetical protein HI914_01081 [Erysiphe necator]|uniref:Putative hydantoin racemase n=1 Tax=Uncinula necator TaxID=52586 RepID=A0A0B1P8H9_UNCNE|nr:hypothetical protein HI914_01081 [Erysiphe necator]KHJ35002.1 putative hydantoin racemase [Erysiphe necator]